MQKAKIVKILSFVLAIMMLGMTGCQEQTKTSTAVSDSDIAEYPFKKEVTLTMWRQMDAALSTTVSNMADSEYSKELAKRTGVTIEYQHPAAGNVQEGFNIMISSGDLPDLIYYPWEWYPGGAAKAITDGHIIPINDYLEKYAPAYKGYIDTHPEIAKALKTENGDFYGFNSIKDERILQTSAGLIMRKDWLDDLGMQPPETMDEMYTVLKAMKEQKGVEFPYSGNLYQAGLWGLFTSAYGVLPELYVDGDQVKYGSVQPGYKEYLTTMNKWYNEGLIDHSFPTLDAKTINSNMMNGFSALTNAAGGSGMGVYLHTMQEKDPNYDLIALKTPVLNKGDRPMYGHISLPVSGHCVAITPACEIPEAAAKYLDYNYTEEGHMFASFGFEGKTYEMIDGEPVYTEFITNNPDGLSMSAVMAQYMISNSVGGGAIGDSRYILQYYQLPQQQEALKIWSDNDADKHILPNVCIAEDKLSEVSRMLTDLNTYSTSMTMKFVMGTEPLENYDAFVEKMKAMGVETVQAAYTEALARYNQR